MAAIHFNQVKPKRLAFILLGVSLFSLPFGSGPASNLFLLLLAILSLIGMKAQDWRYSLSSPITWSSWLFFLLYGISLSYSNDVDTGLRDLETKLSFFLGPPVLVAMGRYFTSKEKQKLQEIFILACAVSLLAALAFAAWRSWEHQAFSYIKPNGSQEHFFFLYETLAEPFMHPGYLSTLYGIAMIILVKGLWAKPLAAKRTIYWFIIIFLAIGLFLLQGRINVLALMIVLGSMILGQLISKKRWSLIIAGIGVLAIFIISFLSFAPSSIKERYLAFPDFSYDISGTNFNSATFRLAEWECAWLSIQEAPWFGHGIGDAEQSLFDSYAKKGFQEGLNRRYNAHNQYLETSIALGVIGLLALINLLSVYSYRAFKLNRGALFASLIFFILCMSTESMFERAWAVVSFNVLFPFFLSSDKKPD